MSQRSTSVIMLEFNELTPSLMDRFIDAGHLPNFQRLRSESHVYTTDAEEDGDNLQPWVQWVSVHTGLSAAENGITRLSDGHKLQEKAIWDLLSDAGKRVWVCGSMNARYDKPLHGYLLPDPWSTGLRPFPENEFTPYYDFVRRAVQEHTNDSAVSSKRLALAFIRYMAFHGLSVRTASRILGQVWKERRTGKFKWRRAAILDELQWNVFRHYYRKLKPHFSTFFINSTAHFQHSHWREMEPEIFGVAPAESRLEEFKDAILYGYRKMDELVGQFLDLADPDTILIFCTALSQQPFTGAEGAGGRHFYRLKDPSLLTTQLGLQTAHTFHPVMAEQFAIRFPDVGSARSAMAHLMEYRIGSRSLFHITVQDSDLMIQCTQTRLVPDSEVIRNSRTSEELAFYELFYRLDNLQSGHHHPDGMLWVRYPNRTHHVYQKKQSVRSIAPAVLEMFELPRPSYMQCEPFPGGQPPTMEVHFRDPACAVL